MSRHASLQSRCARLLMLFGLLVSCPAIARAQLSLTLTPDSLSGPPGSTLTFTGILTNNYASRLYLTSLVGQFSSSSGTVLVDAASFFDYTPPFLEAGQTYTGSIFDVRIAPLATPGNYSGNVQILGGFIEGEELPQVFRDILVAVTGSTVIPEPSPAKLMLPLLGGWLLIRRRQGDSKVRKQVQYPCHDTQPHL